MPRFRVYLPKTYRSFRPTQYDPEVLVDETERRTYLCGLGLGVQSVTIRLSMFMLDLMQWWYGAGWAGVLTANKNRLSKLADMFSVSILLRTLFSPWKRIISYPGAGLEARMRALGDNIVSRCIGFTVRSFVLLSAAIMLVCLLILELVEIIIWPLIPIAGLGLIVKGLM